MPAQAEDHTLWKALQKSHFIADMDGLIAVAFCKPRSIRSAIARGFTTSTAAVSTRPPRSMHLHSGQDAPRFRRRAITIGRGAFLGRTKAPLALELDAYS